MAQREIIDFEFFRESIPILEVADALGISVSAKHWMNCPCHGDKNPSALIGDNSKPKYKNSWHCFVCGEGGSPIDLVLAKKYGIKPSEQKQNKAQYTEQTLGAIHFLDSMFPGGITYISDNSEREETGKPKEPEIPNIPYHILHELDLKTNPLYPIPTRGGEQIDVSRTDRAEMLLDKFLAREQELWSYAISVTQNFPKLSASANAEIFRQARAWIAEIHPYTLAVQKYYFEVSELDYPGIDFGEFETEDTNHADLEPSMAH